MSLGPAANASATLGAVIGNIHLASTGAYIYGNATNTLAALTSAGLEFTQAGVKMAIFGAITVIGSSTEVTTTSTDDCIRIADGTITVFRQDSEKAILDGSGLSVYDGSTSLPNAVIAIVPTLYEI